MSSAFSQLCNIASDFNPRLKYSCSVMLNTVPYLSGLSTIIFAATVYTESTIQQPNRSERTPTKTTKATDSQKAVTQFTSFKLATCQCEMEGKISGKVGGSWQN